MPEPSQVLQECLMYEKFYGLTTRPFTTLPNPYFLYGGRTHTLAYSMLEYGILNEAGFTVITRQATATWHKKMTATSSSAYPS